MAQKLDLQFLDHLAESLRKGQEGLAQYNKAAFPERTPQFFALELAGEAGEIANKEKKIWKGRELPKEDLEEEAADVLIAVMNYANSRNIDLAKALKEKVIEIEKRRQTDLKENKPI